MTFGFPKLRVNESTWFEDEGHIFYGVVTLISIAMNAEAAAVWYTITDEGNEEHVISEDQLTEENMHLPTPKYKIGQAVAYTYATGQNKMTNVVGIIDNIQMGLYEDDTNTVQYQMQKTNDMIDEDDIFEIVHVDERHPNIIDASSQRL